MKIALFRVIFMILWVLHSKASDIPEKSLHHLMTENEIQTIFGVENHEEVPEYDITHPYQASRDGEFVTYDLRSKHRARRAVETDDTHHYSLNAFGKTLHLNLRENKNLIKPGLEVETHAGGKVKKTRLQPSTHYLGEVRDHPESSVAITNHGALSGAIHLKDETFFVRPVPHRLAEGPKMKPGGTPHVLFRTNLKKENLIFNDLKRSVPSIFDEPSSSDHSSNVTHKYLEAALVADEEFYQKYGNDTTNVMVTLANIVAGRFNDPSIGKIKIVYVLTRLVLITDKELNATNDKLGAISRWASKHNPESDKDPDHFDVVSLLMGASGGGLASLGTICHRSSSNICGNKGLGTIFSLVHETAHNLGVNHDIVYGCPDGTNLMSTGHIGKHESFKWSNCSRNKIQEILKKPNLRCMDDAPQLKLTPTLPPALQGKLPGVIYDRMAQCKMQFGPNAVVCPVHHFSCSHLYCKTSASLCTSAILAPADGTRCGNRNWCINGECVDDGSPIIHGGWSEWSAFGSCTRTCGGGVRYKTRTCTKPPPQNGGKDCKGINKGLYEICNSKECENIKPSHRTLQCRKFDKDFTGYFRKDPCQLVCLKNSFIHFKGTVTDGTRCQDERKVLDVCIQGKCEAVGCDSKLQSGAVQDRCGVCDGDGSTCELVKGSYTTNYRKYGFKSPYTILTLPVGASKVIFQERAHSWNKLGVLDKNAKYVYRLPYYTETVYYAGAKITHFSKTGTVDKERLEIDGPITEPLRVVYVYLYGANEGFDYSYYRPSSNTSVVTKYEWKIGNWSACSLSCAKGTKKRSVQCVRSDDGTPASQPSCTEKKPASSMECNTQKCPPEWHVTDWSPCSRSCGQGKQARSLVCRARTNETHHDINLPFSSCDINSKPNVTDSLKYCNQIDCPAQWKSLPWSKCSATCNGGMTTRALQCVILDTEGIVTIVPDVHCKHEFQPAKQQACNTDIMCQAPPPIPITCFKIQKEQLAEFEFTTDLRSTVDWKNTNSTIKECAQFTYDKGGTYFALGNQGICYSGKNASKLYYKGGGASYRGNCENGIGKSRFIYAYTFDKLPVLNSLGCYRDYGSVFPNLYLFLRGQINWRHMDLTIKQCARVARDMGHAYFGVHYYGECYTAPAEYAAANYARKGKSTSCWSGVGSSASTFFYTFKNVTITAR